MEKTMVLIAMAPASSHAASSTDSFASLSALSMASVHALSFS